MAHQGRDKRPYIQCDTCHDTGGCYECTCADCGAYLRVGESQTCDSCKEDEEKEYAEVE